MLWSNSLKKIECLSSRSKRSYCDVWSSSKTITVWLKRNSHFTSSLIFYYIKLRTVIVNDQVWVFRGNTRFGSSEFEKVLYRYFSVWSTNKKTTPSISTKSNRRRSVRLQAESGHVGMKNILVLLPISLKSYSAWPAWPIQQISGSRDKVGMYALVSSTVYFIFNWFSQC